ncbi:DUF4190 domain-containing protein [Streptomyces sp. NPDC005728]|uniref:DUF4190 domain-containing protein n=1 Tax=Streptomyces sp. NPDC005728 TaxID=3157054 RepID=UPI003408D892
MSDEVPQPLPPEHDTGGRPTSPRLSLNKGTGERAASEQPGEGAVEDRPVEQATQVGPGQGAAQPESADPWAAPVSLQGPGDTVLSGPSPALAPHPSLHDQQTVTSLPATDEPADAIPPAWVKPAAPITPPASAPAANTPANPFAPPASAPAANTPANPFAPPAYPPAANTPANPFAPPASAPPASAPPASAPAAAAPANPFAPPAPVPPANPFAPPGAGSPAGTPASPYAPPAASGSPYGPPAAPGSPYAPPTAAVAQPQETVPVPPPPVSPEGPGQVPYGYPGGPSAYGYPAPQPAHGGPGIPVYPAAGGYGWPGLQPQPNNGMGTASLVLGILATVGFCLWPLALVMGVVAVVLGALGRGKARRGEATNPGVALAGIICGAAGIVLVLGLFAFAIAAYKG